MDKLLFHEFIILGKCCTICKAPFKMRWKIMIA
uniref:Uncharacterized protein n=1 Tax=Rhizophora mucronata TaxID=61149 RepID=A0A2P2N0Y5_RHIMU